MAGRRGREVLCGVHAVLAALETGRVERLWLASGRGGRPGARARELAERAGLRAEVRPPEELERLAATRHHQGMVAEARPTPLLALEELLERQPPGKPPLLLLDGVQDPRNLGAILRTAAALGAGGVVWPKDAAVGLTPAAARAAEGALEVVPLARVTNMSRAVSAVKTYGYWTIAGDPRGEAVLGRDELPRPAALVVGGEGRGVRRLVRESCDLGVRISLVGGIVDSLNVAVATGILLFALVAPGSGDFRGSESLPPAEGARGGSGFAKA